MFKFIKDTSKLVRNSFNFKFIDKDLISNETDKKQVTEETTDSEIDLNMILQGYRNIQTVIFIAYFLLFNSMYILFTVDLSILNSATPAIAAIAFALFIINLSFTAYKIRNCYKKKGIEFSTFSSFCDDVIVNPKEFFPYQIK